MDWPQRQREGFALAAAVHGDPGAAAALRGLAPDAQAQAGEVASTLLRMDRSARHAHLRDLIVWPELGPLDEAGWPARALALLAPSVDRTRGRRWLERCPTPRLGFGATRDLIALLRQLIAPTAAEPGASTP